MRSHLGLLAAMALGGVEAEPQQIRAVTDPIFHLYLQASPSDPTMPVMGPVNTSEYYTIANGAIQSANTSAYLTISGSLSGSPSYKTLFLNTTETAAPGWALEGDTIVTATGSSWGRQLNFLACEMSGDSGYWQIYLQTGSDVPTGQTCSNYQTLHLPCLC
ncbi:hypothetical protein F5Y16DRAFT_315445 [Xylariaceae sp. FL0255]|nr:hypothetical protein F5Y16DRAFT_315445 [Xylariaceae sp. FL0255]